MSQPFLHAGEHGLVVARFDIDHAVGRQPGLRDRWSEQIGPGDTPQNLTLGAGGDPRTEKRSGGSVDCAIAAAGYFMQRAEGEPFAWQTRVHRGNPEGENRFGAPAAAFDLFDLRAQRLYSGLGPQASC
ncbi:hypothetical protein SPZE110945_05010 [Sphingomonas zeae]